jgi:hypothetical protein
MSNEKIIEGTLYFIKVKGSLDTKWADWFEGFVMASSGNGETLLHGRVADQAALHGILSRINNLGLSLVLVAQIDHPYIGMHCPLCGQYTDFIEGS